MSVRPLRVLSLATLYPNEGRPNFGVFVARQMEAVAALGDIEPVVINAVGIPPWPLSRLARAREARALAATACIGGVDIHRPRFTALPAFGAWTNARALARAVLPLARRLHAQQPFGVVDAQFFWPDGPAAVRIGRALGLPVSIKARGADIHHWGTARGSRHQVIAAGRAAQGLLAVSSGLAQDMARLGMPAERIVLHRTGLDHTLFRVQNRAACRAALGLPAGVPMLATVGALIARKGQSFVIEALAAIPGAILLLAGAGPDEASLRLLAARLGVSDRVRFLGPVPHGQLPAVLGAADVFVLPTLSEGLANAWVEALACGVPVVTTPIPGAQELLTEPAFGRLAPRDPAAIAAAVSNLLASPPTPQEVARAAQGFSWQENAAALAAHWRRLTAQANPAD